MDLVQGANTQSHIRTSYYKRSPFYPSHDEQAALLADRRHRLAVQAARQFLPDAPHQVHHSRSIQSTDDAATPTMACTSQESALKKPDDGAINPINPINPINQRRGGGLSSYEKYMAREYQRFRSPVPRLAIDEAPSCSITGARYFYPRRPRAITGAAANAATCTSMGSSRCGPSMGASTRGSSMGACASICVASISEPTDAEAMGASTSGASNGASTGGASIGASTSEASNGASISEASIAPSTRDGSKDASTSGGSIAESINGGSITESTNGSSLTAISSVRTSASTSATNLNDMTTAVVLSAISKLEACLDGAEPPPIFSRKVFIGGLPIDITGDEIEYHFTTYGTVKVDWPHKVDSRAVFPPKGFAFLHFKVEPSVKELVAACTMNHGHFYTQMMSPHGGWKRVEIIPWQLKDADYSKLSVEDLDSRKIAFVGGIPRPCTASKLASIMDDLFGCVVYAGIDTDLEFQYPKGSGRVCFSSQNSFVNALSSRFVEVVIGHMKKRVEIKPYVLDQQLCDICHGANTDEKYGVFYCYHYHCSQCWAKSHCRAEYKFHKPLIKEPRNATYENMNM